MTISITISKRALLIISIVLLLIMGIGAYFFLLYYGGADFASFIKKTRFSDREVRWAVADEEHYPSDFYYQDLTEPFTYVTVPDEAHHSRASICSDDMEKALEIVQTNEKTAYHPRQITRQKETDKYFEFATINPDDLSDLLLMRVHKCSYFDPRTAKEIGEVGTFNQRPITADNAKELIQYWIFLMHGKPSRILSAFFEREPSKYVVYDLGASKQGPDCTIFTIARSEYTLDPDSGAFSFSSEPIRGGTLGCLQGVPGAQLQKDGTWYRGPE